MTFIFWSRGGFDVSVIHECVRSANVNNVSWGLISHKLEIRYWYKEVFTKTVLPGSCVIIDDNNNLYQDLKYLDK